MQIPITLRDLRRKVDRVAAKQQVVFGRHGEGVTREGGRVDNQSGGQLAGDAIPIVNQLRSYVA